MKKFIFAFVGFCIVICLALLIINYPNGDVDTNTHLHLDVWVSTFNDSLSFNNNEGIIANMNYLMQYTHTNFPIPALRELAIVGMWLFNSIVEVINVIRAVVTTFTTPVIFP